MMVSSINLTSRYMESHDSAIGSITIARNSKMIASSGAAEDIRPLATDDEFCAFAGLSKQQSAQLRYLGKGPRFIRVTGRQIRYAWSDIEEWCEVRTVSRSDQRGELPASQRK